MKASNDLLIPKLYDDIDICVKKNRPVFLGFLSDTEQDIVIEHLKKQNDLYFCFWGGNENCERKILGLFPYEYYTNSDFPIVAVNFSYKKEYSLRHKDFLGTLMAEGLKREVIGDIVIDKGNTVVFLYEKISSVVLSQISKIGGVGVSTSVINGEAIEIERQFSIINRTISSLRLDCVVSALANLSRTRSTLLIKSGKVFINGIDFYNNDKIINVGDKITVRGVGKFIFDSTDGETKKDRIRVIFKKYM